MYICFKKDDKTTLTFFYKICQSAKSYFLFQDLCKEGVIIDDDKHNRNNKDWEYEYLK